MALLAQVNPTSWGVQEGTSNNSKLLLFFLLSFPRLSWLSAHMSSILSHCDSKMCKGIWRIETKCAMRVLHGVGPSSLHASALSSVDGNPSGAVLTGLSG